MTKGFVDKMIQNMKRAELVTKASPWLVEGIGNKHMHVRYVGIKGNADWLEIFSSKDNLLIKFIIDKQTAFLEFYIANKTPFFKFTSLPFHDLNKWEPLLGEVKRVLKRDKASYINHIYSPNSGLQLMEGFGNFQ